MLSHAEAWLATVSAGDRLRSESRPCVVCGDSREHIPRRTVFCHQIAAWLATLSVFTDSPCVTVCRNMLNETVRMQPEVPVGEETVALCAHCATFTKQRSKAWHPISELDWYLRSLEPIRLPNSPRKAFDRRLLIRLAKILAASNVYRQCLHPTAIACCDALAASANRASAAHATPKAAPHAAPHAAALNTTSTQADISASNARRDHALVVDCVSCLSADSLFTHSATAAEHLRGIFLEHILR